MLHWSGAFIQENPALIAQEALNGRILLAALIIVGSVVLINTAKKPAPPAPEPDEIV